MDFSVLDIGLVTDSASPFNHSGLISLCQGEPGARGPLLLVFGSIGVHCNGIGVDLCNPFPVSLGFFLLGCVGDFGGFKTRQVMYLGGLQWGGDGDDVLEAVGYPSEASSILGWCDGCADHLYESSFARVVVRAQ